MSGLIKLTLKFKSLKLNFMEQVKGWPHSGFFYYNYSVLARLSRSNKGSGFQYNLLFTSIPTPGALAKPGFLIHFFPKVKVL